MSKIPILTHEEADNRIYAALYPPEKKMDKAKIRESMIKIADKQVKNGTK
ncbi:MAG: hypothetical protein WC261_13880 [Synergistaceae bacterium]|jgi:hypothetical protein